MIERPNVDALMAGELGRFLLAQIAVRQEARAKTNKRYVMAGIALVPLAIVLFLLPVGDFKLWGTALAGMGAWWWARQPIMAAKKQTKSGINEAIARALGLEYCHDCDSGHGFDRARLHKMFPSFQRSKFEDLWSGDVNGHPFTLREAHLEERQGSGKNQRWVTVFRGPVITMGFSRAFHGTTLLDRAGRHRKFLFFGEADEIKIDGVVLQKADMVHPDFEDAFTVFTSDQTEARYLVHPRYIERLIALESAFRGQGIKTLFKDREITIVLKAENMFESGSLDHNRDREMVELCVNQFMAMADLCKELNEPER